MEGVLSAVCQEYTKVAEFIDTMEELISGRFAEYCKITNSSPPADVNPTKLFSQSLRCGNQLTELKTRIQEIKRLKDELVEYIEEVLIIESERLSNTMAANGLQEDSYHQHHHRRAVQLVQQWKIQMDTLDEYNNSKITRNIRSINTGGRSINTGGISINTGGRSINTGGRSFALTFPPDSVTSSNLNLSYHPTPSQATSESIASSQTNRSRRLSCSNKAIDKTNGNGTASLSKSCTASLAHSKNNIERHRSKSCKAMDTGDVTRTRNLGHRSIQPSRTKSSIVFKAVTNEAFEQVPTLIRRRSKLRDINDVYHFICHYTNNARRRCMDTTIGIDCKIAQRAQLWSRVDLTRSDFYKAKLSVVGQTGEAKLQTLKYLKMIEITRDDIIFIAAPKKC